MSIFIKRDPLRSWLLWWSPDGHKWYPINSKNMQPMPDGDIDNPFEAFRLYREQMNRVYAGYVETFDGAYDKATGRLKVKALRLQTPIISGTG